MSNALYIRDKDGNMVIASNIQILKNELLAALAASAVGAMAAYLVYQAIRHPFFEV